MSIINSLHYDLQTRKSEFFSAYPFPHLILDNFLRDDFFQEISIDIASFESALSEGSNFNTELEKGKWISLNSSLSLLIKIIIDEMNSEQWVSNLRQLTGIESLHVTKVGNTKLANYHVMKPGGALGPHVDHATDPETGSPHVLNNLLYLSEFWRPEFGGGTELFDSSGRLSLAKIEYRPNRLVVFLHTPYSFHGVEKISHIAPYTRKSIYVDYYSVSLNPYDNLTLPFRNHWFYHPTTFTMDSMINYLKPRNFNYLKSSLIYKFHKTGASLFK